MSERGHLWLIGLCVLFACAAAAAIAWMCDDAFITIRYAGQLVDGNGLVFNPGERVEGYSNFLWTLWCAVGLAMGTDIELWSHAASITAAGATVVLLGVLHVRHRTTGWSVPLACVALAVHRDFIVHATSGLETALFGALVLAAFVVLTGGAKPSSSVTVRRSFVTGLVLGLAALTRPDAPLVAGCCGLFVLWRADAAMRCGAAIFAGFSVFWLPHLAWRYGYYGSLVPNTALAKSAHLAWWAQGWTYVSLYVQRYPVLLVGPVALVVRCVRGRTAALNARPDLVLAAGIALVHALYVARVGGDFMFARFMLPATPLLLWLFEGEAGLLITKLRGEKASNVAAIGGLTVAVVAAMIAVPSPVSGTQIVDGVADEYGFYTAAQPELGNKSTSELTAEMGNALRPFFAGLPVRILVIGSQARLAWASRAAVAIEANGLTDATIAAQPLTRRGRPGHEKHPTYAYIVRDRAVHFAFSPTALHLVRGRIPILAATFGTVQGLLLTWDSSLMAKLRARGAKVPDYLGLLDKTIVALPTMPTATAEAAWQAHRDFYFLHNEDPQRQAAFQARLRP